MFYLEIPTPSIHSAFFDPIVAAAIVALIGVLATQFVVAWSRKKQYRIDLETIESEKAKLENDKHAANSVHELETLKTSVEVLKSEYSRLSLEVKELRAEIMSERKAKHECRERYSIAIAFVGSLLASAKTLFNRLNEEGVQHAPLPEIPLTLRADLYKDWPELEPYIDEEETDG